MFAKGLVLHTKGGMERYVRESVKGCFEKVYKVCIDILEEI